MLPQDWLAFDLADAMELGSANQLTDQFEEAQGIKSVRELSVYRSADKTEHTLVGKDTRCLLTAKSVGEFAHDIYVATGGSPSRAGPAFRLRANAAGTQWEYIYIYIYVYVYIYIYIYICICMYI